MRDDSSTLWAVIGVAADLLPHAMAASPAFAQRGRHRPGRGSEYAGARTQRNLARAIARGRDQGAGGARTGRRRYARRSRGLQLHRLRASQSEPARSRPHRRAANRFACSCRRGDRWGEAQGYNTLGLIEADAGRFVDALQNHLKALAIREKDGDKEGLSYTFNNLGNIYRNMGDYQKALEFHQRGLELKIVLGNKSSEAYSHHNIGLVYFVMKDYANALAAYRRGLVIREQLKDPRSIAVSLNAIGQVEALTNPAAALAHLPTRARAAARDRRSARRDGDRDQSCRRLQAAGPAAGCGRRRSIAR